MLIKTRSSGIVWVDWPPVDDGEVWCRGFDPDERATMRVYRLVDGAWVEGSWEDVEPRPGGGLGNASGELH